MEPIEPFVETSFPTSRHGRRAGGKKRTERVAFHSVLEVANEESAASSTAFSALPETGDDLEALLDNVSELGEKLKESVSLSVVQDYKQAVRDFLAYVVRNTLALERHESGPNVMKRKRFTLIRVIDQKLERLAAGIMLDQRTQLDLLRRIDEISGLLIDLLS